ncbi:MAG TPA: MEDS domain-containing protein [Gemmatimonadaceae bacterium]|jgi:C4-dicarboxylate-specific signal transduction histidine kinase
MTTAIPTELRKTGVDVVGDVPWGTHFCLFYDTKAALLDTVVPYCKAGLESGEFCLWVVAPPLTVAEALEALRQAVPDFSRYFADGCIEIVGAHDWYLQDGAFDLTRVIAGWNEKLAHASAKGYVGVRVTGDTTWLERKDWADFCEYEESLNVAIANQRLAVLCTYPLAACSAGEILDVVKTHQFAVTRRLGAWEIIETAGHKQAKAEIKRLNDELELRVVERTSQLLMANEELTKEIHERQRAEEQAELERERLRQAQADLVRVSRVTTMGELTASLAHEIKQPMTAALLHANACVRWLARDEPAIAEARETAAGIAKEVKRASEIINHIGGLFQKAAPQREAMDVNEVIQEMVALLGSEVTHNAISIRRELQRDLPMVRGDRVQLQQVLMNLTLNGIDAMKETERVKELTITSEAGDGELVVSISDTGTGIGPEHADRIFDAFYTTKSHGLGMGLAISRSIVESHGGRLWVTSDPGSGANFHLTLPVQAD